MGFATVLSHLYTEFGRVKLHFAFRYLQSKIFYQFQRFFYREYRPDELHQ
jgi:hypothetical protein